MSQTEDNTDDWRRFMETLTEEELRVLDRILRGQGRPRTLKGQAVHHLDGNPYNNDLANLKIVDITENRRK